MKNIFRNKAVSDGAISFYLDHFVRTRVSKVTYGSFCSITYDPNLSDHRSRSHKVYTSVSGNKRISGSFDIILPKVRSCFFNPLFSKIMFWKNLFIFVEHPNFGAERIQKVLYHRIGFIRLFWSCFFRVVLSWKCCDSKVERRWYRWDSLLINVSLSLIYILQIITPCFVL